MWMESTLLFGVLMITTISLVHSEVTCTLPWKSVHRGCYMFNKKVATWEEARQVCQDEGGYLASMSSKLEAVKVLLNIHPLIRTASMKHWWLGLSLNKTIAKWKWEDGSDLQTNVIAWKPGEPNNSLRDERCGEMNIQGRLNDQKCNTLNPFICEQYPPTFPPPTTTAATFDDTSRSDVEITAMLRESTSKSQVHTVKTTTFFNLNKTFTVGYIQGRTISSQNTTKSASKMSTEGKSLQDNDTSMYTEGVATNNLQTEESTVRPSNIVKTTFRSPFQHEKTTKEESHMGDLSHSSSKPQENLSVSTWVGDGQVGRFFCEPVKAYDISWPIATKGEVVSRPCMVGSGFATWICDRNTAEWKEMPNVDECVSKDIEKILQQRVKSPEDVSQLTADLVDILSGGDRTVADIVTTTRVFKYIPSIHVQDEQAFRNLAQDTISIGSLLVKQTMDSSDLSSADKKRAASVILSAVEDAASKLLDSVDKPTAFQTKSHTILAMFHVLDSTSATDLKFNSDDGDAEFFIPQYLIKHYSKNGLTKVVFMKHSNAADLLPVPDMNYIILRDILSASIFGFDVRNLRDPITFTMKLEHSRLSGSPIATPHCSFWNFSKGEVGDWSQEGCSLKDLNNTHVTCQCDHLTNFAILMDVSGVELGYEHVLSLTFISYIGCVISIIFLATSWLTFQCLGSLQCERNSIHKNLVFCLFVAEVIFVIGVGRTQQKVACAAIALLLHFFFLSAFTWMLMEGIHIGIMLVQVFDAAKSRLKYYYLVGYGAPVVVVGVTATTDFTAYGTDKYCWLKTQNWFIWSFAGPVALVLFVNAMVLFYSMTMVCKHSAYVFSKIGHSQEHSGHGFKEPWLLRSYWV
uniref:Adhesion G protein-coupled receptor L3-like n=1 Tax=Crassostrea virginica TaxID=6565 RepID=A0A8B8CHF0_CRAVI|nr:adhesion G protein-coupled receptor L3-like [Crassostrea virginica]